MNQPPAQLTTEEQFQLKYFEVQVRHMDEQTAKNSLKALFVRMMYRQEEFKQQIGEQWSLTNFKGGHERL